MGFWELTHRYEGPSAMYDLGGLERAGEWGGQLKSPTFYQCTGHQA